MAVFILHLFPILRPSTFYSLRSIKFIVKLLKCNENEIGIGIAHTEREKKTRDEWMDGLHTILKYHSWNCFFYDRCLQFNFIYFCLKWANISFETKSVRACWMCALDFSLSLEIAVKCGNTFKAPLDKSAGTGMVSFSSPFLLRINKIKFLNLK